MDAENEAFHWILSVFICVHLRLKILKKTVLGMLPGATWVHGYFPTSEAGTAVTRTFVNLSESAIF